MPHSRAVTRPVASLFFLPTKPVVVTVAVAVKMLTSRTCPFHPTSIAAAGAVSRWFAAASSRRFFRAVTVDVGIAMVVVFVAVGVAAAMAVAV